MSSATIPPVRTPHPTTLDDLRDLGTCDVWSPTAPNAAGLLGISKEVAYDMARRGDLPVVRLGITPDSKRPRLRVLVPKLLALVGAGELTT